MGARLGDDGTLDTVLVCKECGKEVRYNFDVGPDDTDISYDSWVVDILAEFDEDHECGEGDDND